MKIKVFVFDAYGTLFDTQSVLPIVEAHVPLRSELIAQLWRMKQLEYTWLWTLMGRDADFEAVTRQALRFTLDTLAPGTDEATVATLCDAFNRLRYFPDAADALERLRPYRLAILSNGSAGGLESLLAHAGLRDRFEPVVSTESARVFKPHPDAYHAFIARVGFAAGEIALVSSNGFDLAGAKSLGMRTVRIERTTPRDLRELLGEARSLSPHGMFAAMRGMAERLDGAADLTCSSLKDLAAVASEIAVADPSL